MSFRFDTLFYNPEFASLNIGSRIFRSNHHRGFAKIWFQKFRKIHRKILVTLFNKITCPRACDFIKKRLQHRCFPANFAKFKEHLVCRISPVGCFWMLWHWGFLSAAEPDPDFARSVITRHGVFKTLYFTCAYLIFRVRKSYLFAGKWIFFNFYEMYSLNPFLKSFNIELETSLSADFLSALFSKHSAKRNSSLDKTSAKQYVQLSPNFIYFLDMMKTNSTRLFNKQPSCRRSNAKNGLKVKQLAKQPPTIKTLMQKNFGWILSKKFYFFNFKFTEAKFLQNCFWHNFGAILLWKFVTTINCQCLGQNS